MDRKSIIDKIRALKKLEARTSSQNEAEAATYAIAGIIDRYKLSVAELDEEKQDKERGDVKKDDLRESWKRLPNYKRVLLNAITKHMGVSVIVTKNQDGTSNRTLVGFSSDVEIAKHLYSWLSLEASDMSPKGHGKGYSQSWCMGFARGIEAQLKKSRQGTLESVPNTSSALMVLDKSDMVKSSVKKMFPEMKTTYHYYGSSSDEAFMDGKLQGESTHLGKRLSGNPA